MLGTDPFSILGFTLTIAIPLVLVTMLVRSAMERRWIAFSTIIAVVVAISAFLVWFLSPGVGFIPERCTFALPATCIDAIAQEDHIAIRLLNGADENLTIVDVSLEEYEGGGYCESFEVLRSVPYGSAYGEALDPPVLWPSNETVDITLIGCPVRERLIGHVMIRTTSGTIEGEVLLNQ